MAGERGVQVGGCRLPTPLKAQTVTAIASEIDRFDRLSSTWWDPAGPMRPLHVVNELRLFHLMNRINTHFGYRPMSELRVLDVGCGAGLLSEPVAQAGAHVVGIDASGGNLAAARRHAQAQGVAVDYRHGEPAQVLGPAESFDVVLALEVVEHVDDVPGFVATVAHAVAPGGLLVMSTIDRTWKSFLFAIVGAEYLLRVLPRGTHQWQRFVRPAELHAAVASHGLRQIDLRGMRYQPLSHRATWCADTRVNYMATYAR